MNLKSTILILLICGVVGTTSSDAAPATPVYDPLNHAQNILNWIETKLIQINTAVNTQKNVVQVRNQIKQLYEMKRQYEQLKHQAKMLSGKHGYGKWLKGPARLLDPYYKPESVEDIVELMRSGHVSGSLSSRQDYENYRKKYPMPSETDFDRYDPGSTRATSGVEWAGRSGGLDVLSGTIFKKTVKRGEYIEDLIKKIDKSEGLKSTMDINSHLLGQVALMMKELLEIQSLQSSVYAVKQRRDIEGEIRDMKDVYHD